MKAEHTPGPWRRSRPYRGWDPTSHEAWGELGPVWACAYIDDDNLYCSEADARLICAAPDLLATCKWASEQLQNLETIPGRYLRMDVMDLIRKELDEAIRKATEEDPEV